MTTVTITPEGISVAIPDAKGELHDYAASVVKHSLGRWACELKREGKTKTYLVYLDGRGDWVCNCPDAQFRGFLKREETCCKHVKAGQDVYELCKKLVGV